jgi:hypothetical protein
MSHILQDEVTGAYLTFNRPAWIQVKNAKGEIETVRNLSDVTLDLTVYRENASRFTRERALALRAHLASRGKKVCLRPWRHR